MVGLTGLNNDTISSAKKLMESILCKSKYSWKRKLSVLTIEYEAKDIYHTNETGLFQKFPYQIFVAMHVLMVKNQKIGLLYWYVGAPQVKSGCLLL